MMALLLAISSVAPHEAFWSRDLTALRFAVETMVLEEANANENAGPAHFWTELEALVGCHPLKPSERKPHVPASEWERLLALVRLERLRLQRVGMEGSFLSRSLDGFRREPLVSSDELIEWPHSEERWDDEFLWSEPRASECGKARPAADPAAAMEEEQRAAEAILSTMPRSHPAFVSLVLHLVSLQTQQGALEAAWQTGARLEGLSPEEISPEELYSFRLVRALSRESRGETEGLVEEWQALMSMGPDASEALVQSRLERILLLEKRWEELLSATEEAPRTKDAPGWYRAWLRGRALEALERRAELLAHVRETLRSVPESSLGESSVRALLDLGLSSLAKSEFDERVVELVEGLGAPRLLYSRLERLAEVALLSGRVQVASDAWNWLIIHHQNAQAHPRYRAGLADVAFLSGNRAAFRARLVELSAPDPRLLEVIPSSRRGAFFDERDKALLGLARRIVPRLGERGDELWTRTFVDVLQTFLREAPESRSHASLLELYRSARGLLPTGARQYSERVGQTRPVLVLGEVKIERALPDPVAPKVLLQLDEPRHLLRIPTSGGTSPLRAWFEETPP